MTATQLARLALEVFRASGIRTAERLEGLISSYAAVYMFGPEAVSTARAAAFASLYAGELSN